MGEQLELARRGDEPAEGRPVEAARPVVGGDEKGGDAPKVHAEAGEVGEAYGTQAARPQDAVDGAAAEARHAQQVLAGGTARVDREALAVLQRPGELRVEREVEHPPSPAGQDLPDREAVEAEQPVG